MKIGRYTEDEILEHLTEGEGRGFLGRSMYDAIFVKIHALITENEQLKNDNANLKERYNNMFECHCNRVQVEKLQNNWNKIKTWLELIVMQEREGKTIYLSFKDILSKMQEQEGNNE